MPEQVFRGLAELIPCSSVGFYVSDPYRREWHAGQEVELQEWPFATASSETGALFWQSYWECAACRTRWSETVASTTQDLHSEREYATHRTADFHQWRGRWHDLVVRLPPQGRYTAEALAVRRDCWGTPCGSSGCGRLAGGYRCVGHLEETS